MSIGLLRSRRVLTRLVRARREITVLLAAATALAAAPDAVSAPRAHSAAAASAIFFSGVGTAGYEYIGDYARYRVKYDTYTDGDKSCSTSNATPNTGGNAIRTIAGWSAGRMGVVYYVKEALKQNSGRRLSDLRYVLLFDPASNGEMNAGCDSQVDVDGILAKWLASNRDNRLVIMAGWATLGGKKPDLYSGIRNHYFSKIASTGQAAKTLVCNVESNGVPYSHEDVMKHFAYMTAGNPVQSCPRGYYGWRAGELPYARAVVKWNNEQPSPRTAWLVGDDGKRRWIADATTYDCLLSSRGKAWLLTAKVLDLLADQRGQRAECITLPVPLPTLEPIPILNPGPVGPATGPRTVTLAQGPAAPHGFRYAITLSGYAAGESVSISCRDSVDPGGFVNFSITTDASGSAFTESQCYSGDGPDHWVVAGDTESNHVIWGAGAPAPTPVPTAAPPRTWPEQQGSRGANTFTNPNNASGMGAKIAAYQWVEVSCKVYAPQIQSANPDGYWYRISSAPWNNAYYAVANTFWNGDVPGHLPYTHNTDWNVPNC